MARRGGLRRGVVGLRQRAAIAVMPSFRAIGTVGAATTGTTVAGPLPTNSADDILIAILFCRGSTTPFTMPAGWAEITQITVGTNQFAWFWKRAGAGETNPTVTNLGRTSTNLLGAQLLSFSGCRKSGVPYEGLLNNSSASGVLTGINVITTGIKRLALQLWARGANSASTQDGEWTERLDQGTSGGGACRFMADSAPMEFAGTMPACGRGASAQLYGMIGIALIGEGAEVATVTNPLRRSMWVWDAPTVLGVANDENILLNECVNSGIGDLYLYSPLASFATDAADYRSFIARATALGIRCWGMDGYRGWFSDGDGPQELYDTIDAMIAYNAASTAAQRFVGFSIDQEPADIDTFTTFHNGIASSALSTTPGSGDWQSTEALDREFLMRDWVDIHVGCRSRLSAAGLMLGTALPTWFDDYFGEPVTCTYGGLTRNVFLPISENADDLVIMNYSTNPLNQISRIGYELPAATVMLSTGIETHTGPGTGVSYADTVGKQTKAAALADLAIVRARYAHYPRFAGDAIHDWEGWKALSPASVDTSDPLA